MKSMKKLFAVVLSIALIVSCFAINASAAVTMYSVGLGGAGHLYENEVDSTTGKVTRSEIKKGNVYYDPETNTLTLDNATIEDENGGITFYSYGYNFGQGTIIVKGDCVIKIKKYTAIYQGQYTATEKLPLIIKGEGDNASLTIKNEDNLAIPVQSDYGFDIENVNLSITNDVSDNVTGIYATGPITIKDSAVTIDKADTAIASQYLGSAGYPTDTSVTINNSYINITDRRDGIAVYGDSGSNELVISNSKIIIDDTGANPVTSGDDRVCFAPPCCGLHSDTNIDLENSNLFIVSQNTSAIYAANNVEILNCAGTLISNSTQEKECSIYAGSVSIDTDTVVTAGATQASATVIRPTADTTWSNYMYVNLDKKINYTGDNTWTKGSTNGAEIKSDAPYALFDYVTVDGEEVDYANYTVKEGSTIITFKPAYLETLSLGDHEVVVYSLNGSAKGTLTIKEAVTPTPENKAEKEKVANTADNNAIGAFVALSAFAAAGFVSLKKKEN